MTRSVYVLGGAGTGKSTFTLQLLEELPVTPGPLRDLHAKMNRKNLVTLRGHKLANSIGSVRGIYLGVLRDEFPGTDGLDRASGETGEEWLNESDLPPWILAEGATLSTKGFLGALRQHTDLLVVHAVANDAEKLRRFAARGSNQDHQFALKQTVTRAANRASELADDGARVMLLDTTDQDAWELALDLCAAHLGN